MIDEILNQIKQYDTIIIHRHVRPDPDALGSQGGLSCLIKDNFPQKNVYIVGEEAADLRFLVTMDTVDEDVYEEALVIVCDTANRERISDNRYRLGRHLLKIDHHPIVDSYGDLEWVDPQASSTSEMICSIYQRHPELTLSQNAARLLFAGIVGDTGRFQFSNVTSATFRAASELVRLPFDRQSFFNQLYERSLAQVRLNGYVLEHFTLTEEGVGYVKLTQPLIHAYHLTAADASSLVNSFSNVAHLKAWVLFSEEGKVIRARIRSKAPSINQLAEKYHGGGHPMASGATVSSWEEADQLIADLRALCAK
ncbi:bifunctional oligoribonuclease/PAP phosphatase NrnA [Sporolactobacillus sp. CPB3-1]|uniref:Bifunctional oligoribonuclease/PAP phosphatase NrnA n=1 Tax=Sporolactobacillus mangiferae TaxID=2940498 RepID=A0ABT0M6X8_9BACL|nr:bifunctional oligoribonuclease/PAP phosphatase NrnA [Sporolactobacillus mangiferae]MCL1630617.1 bifunctional oligoribonuclease/PAP phosphatase NrnA [Sporolactobacillus mangiferae]